MDNEFMIRLQNLRRELGIVNDEEFGKVIEKIIHAYEIGHIAGYKTGFKEGFNEAKNPSVNK